MGKMFAVFYVLVIAGTLVVALGPSIYQLLTETEDGNSSNGRPHFQDWFENSTMPRFFSFKWVGQNYMVPDGVLWVNITLDWSTDELEATIRLNDERFNATDSIFLAFGKNHSFPKPYAFGAYDLGANNMTYAPSHTYLDEYGMAHYIGAGVGLRVSSYHTCQYEDGVYTFYFHIPKSSVESPLKIHLSWRDRIPDQPGMTNSDILVFVQFGV